MTAYYNEFDPFAAAWLRELIKAGHIAPGDVDERSIKDVTADDLQGYDQHHFFAGVGVWSHALRGAGWGDERPVWTGSCPCQPFSAAGKGGGFDDARHLWPDFFRLIAECRPDVVVGEQVASKDGLNWLDLVHADLEGTGYAVGAVDTCAAGFGAPHIRQRLWWCGVREMADTELPPQSRQRFVGGALVRKQDADGPAGSRVAVGLDGYTRHAGVLQGQAASAGGRLALPLRHGAGDHAGTGMGSEATPDREDGRVSGQRLRSGLEGSLCALAESGIDTAHPGATPEPGSDHADRMDDDHGDGPGQAVGSLHQRRPQPDGGELRPGPVNGFWGVADWLHCRDGRWRPVESSTFPLVDGAPARVGRLRGYGNAIVAPQAQAFVEAVMSCV